MTYPANNGVDERRRTLLQAMSGVSPNSPNGGRLLGNTVRHAVPLFGGAGGHSGEYAPAALPALTFNPFLAQLKGGVQNLNMPTQGFSLGQGGQLQSDNAPLGGVGGGISDLTGTVGTPQSGVGNSSLLSSGAAPAYQMPDGSRISYDLGPGAAAPSGLPTGGINDAYANMTNPFLRAILGKGSQVT